MIWSNYRIERDYKWKIRRMMRFGIVRLYCGTSGKQGFYNSQEIGLARAMKKLGYSTVVFFPDKAIGYVKEEIVEENILLVYCPARSLGVHAYFDWNVIKKYSVNAIQIESDNQIFLFSLVKFCKKNKIKFYNYIGTIESDTLSKLKLVILNIIFKINLRIYRNSQCFVKTAAVYEKLEKLGVRQLKIVPVGLDVTVIPEINASSQALKNKYNIPDDKTIILFVGRMEKYKEPMELVRLMKELPGNFYYLLVGTGSMNHQLQGEIDSVLGKESYQWIKEIPNREIHQLYAFSDFFVNFNRKEIFGMSILEAMYHGCTVTACHAPGPDMIIENGKSGYLVNDAMEMLKYLNAEKKIERKTVQEYVMQNFTWDHSAEMIHGWICANEIIT